VKDFKVEGESILEKVSHASFARFSGVSGLNTDMLGWWEVVAQYRRHRISIY